MVLKSGPFKVQGMGLDTVKKMVTSVGFKKRKGTGEMTQQLRALTVLPEDPCPISSTHVVAHHLL